MEALSAALFAAGAYPLERAWAANRRTSLGHAIAWAAAAWLGWFVHCLTAADAWGYLALCLTGCAGVAVLGARRPGVGAWNFVVAGLLAVLLLPLAEGGIVGGPMRPGAVRIAFLASTLALGIGNYLPTRLGSGALLLALGCAGEMVDLFGPEDLGKIPWMRTISQILAGCAPWAAWIGLSGSRAGGSEFIRLWLDFRDRFGLIWGLRLREQFHRAAANAGCPVALRWSGQAQLPPAPILDLFRGLLKRFGPPEGSGTTP